MNETTRYNYSCTVCGEAAIGLLATEADRDRTLAAHATRCSGDPALWKERRTWA